ncbi:FxsA family protein [Aestuariispira insulae]|uniref:UPF0716 protein FxsA n=1 Tax=Aestuariispira insulae TaxID=1461337 RepID=A0A3D9HPH1_9PROT|nr:FxsA family protein [Aestuariispira insulae]RED51372.1 UPF0716 protein FxsA [Aestuariispira insulae]
MPLLILFILVPIIEITLFIQIGEQIGLGWTIATVIITAFIGTHLVRSQGLRALASAQSSLDQQKLPLEEIFTGLCLLVAGALLLTPGFLTDAIGFTLLAPPFRKVAGRKVMDYLKARGNVHFQTGPRGGFDFSGAQGQQYHRGPGGSGDIIEGEFEVKNDAHNSDRPAHDENDRLPPRS